MVNAGELLAKLPQTRVASRGMARRYSSLPDLMQLRQGRGRSERIGGRNIWAIAPLGTPLPNNLSEFKRDHISHTGGGRQSGR